MLRFDINFVFTIINVLILFAVVKIFLIGRVHKILDARKAQVDEQYAEAEKKLEEADKTRQEYEESIKNIEEEKERRFTEARNQAKSEYDRLMEQAKKETEEHFGEPGYMTTATVETNAEKIKELFAKTA